MKVIFTLIICLLNTSFAPAQSASKVTKKDLQQFLGNWKGTLTYLDYSSGKPYTLPAEINIRQLGKSRMFIFSNVYPGEPKANSSDTITIEKKGHTINTENIKRKRKLNNGDTEIVTEFLSKDGNDNKPATIRHTYLIGKNNYKNTKEVQFAGENKWIERHVYSYTRK